MARTGLHVRRATALLLAVLSSGGCTSGSDDPPGGDGALVVAGVGPAGAGPGAVDGPASVEAVSDVQVLDGSSRDRLRNRDVPYRVYAPVGPTGSVPVVLVSHGGDGNRTGSTTGGHIGGALAAAGFLAVHVGHLPSADLETHLDDRPADASFLLDRLEDGAIALPDGFAGRPDTNRVGHAGHSLGAYTAHALGGATFERGATDARVVAIAPISPQGPGRFGAFDRGAADNSWRTVAVPAFVLVGGEEIDGGVAGGASEPGWRLVPFSRYPAKGDKFQSVLAGQGHREMWGQGGDAIEAYVARELARFFSVYVADGPRASACDIGGAGEGVDVSSSRLPDADASALAGCP